MSDLKSMTKAELRKFADEYYDVVLPSVMAKGDMINLINKIKGRTDEVADIVPESQRQDPKNPQKVGTGPGEGRIRIIVSRTGQDKRQRPLFLGVNGQTCLVKRGVEVDLPAKFVTGALNDAVELAPVWDAEMATAVGHGDFVLKEQHSYPFTIVAFGPGTEKHQKLLGYQ